MAGKIVFVADLWLPPSVNESNGYNSRTGKVYKTDVVADFRDKVSKMINYWDSTADRSQFLPHFILYRDMEAIKEARWAWKSRSKAALATRRWYRMDVLEVYNTDHSDTDNRHKELQDELFRSLIGINDRRCVDIHRKSVVDPTAHRHCEVVIRETQRDWSSGELLRLAALELSLDDAYNAPYGVHDDYLGVVDRTG